MSTKILKCKNCGATMEVDDDKSIVFCPYCGSKELIEDKDPIPVKMMKEVRKIKKDDMDYHERAQKEGREMADKTVDTIQGIVLLAMLILWVIFMVHVFW